MHRRTLQLFVVSWCFRTLYSFSIGSSIRRRVQYTTFFRRVGLQKNPKALVSSSGDSSTSSAYGGEATQAGRHAKGESPVQLPKRYGVDADQIEALRQSIDIISVIESYGLEKFDRKSPTRATACCPFHSDKSPSLHVDADRGIYKCFGCGVGGNAFSFVRAYSKLQGDDLTYYQAIRRVQSEWGDPSLQIFPESPYQSTESQEELDAIRLRKKRITLANAEAAAFYAGCLVKPTSGVARTYIQSRGISPRTVKEFGLGYAPDAYNHKTGGIVRGDECWGNGSLVQHLLALGFSAVEILDSGLATRTNTSAKRLPFQSVVSNTGHDNSTADPSKVTSGSLMDRFRDRLIVPIVDRGGDNVIGLGGRILPRFQSESERGSYEPAKYVNSPESLVFQKGSTLFGENMARAYLRALKSNSSKASRNLIVVEGYMDVIALWNVGVKQAVASMGTALSREQLNAAAKVVQAIDGRVVLCLDNDPAGLAAVERVCGNGLLKEISEKHKVEFRVATLPENVKDPDEYVQATKATVSVGLSFIEDVAELAEDWVSWFVNRIVASYNPDAQRGRLGSFSEVFERVAEHLATAVDAADRTRAAYEVAGTLARILSRESNSTEMSEAVRSQLEADLIDTSARIANVKNSVKRRAETVALDQTDVRVSPESALKALMKGEGPSGIDEQAGNRNFVLIKEDFSSERKGNFPRKRESPELTAQRRTPMRRAKSRVLKLKSQKESEPALTPHFAGFQFANKFDEEWLLDSSPSKSLVLGIESLSSPTRRFNTEKLVYFNSNEYHGTRYLTDDAAAAGYERGRFDRDPSFIEKGVASLLKPDTSRMAQIAEDGLLRTLIRNGSARRTLKNVVDARDAVGSSVDLNWSSDAKAWLFDSLLGKTVDLPATLSDSVDLRNHLAALPSCPAGALSFVDDSDSLLVPVGSGHGHRELDYLFTELDEAISPRIPDDRHVEFEMQQYYSTLLRVSATAKLNALEQAMEEVVKQINDHSNVESSERDGSDEGAGALTTEFDRLTESVADTSMTLQSLVNSAMVASARHLQSIGSSRSSGFFQEDLAAMLDDSMSSSGPSSIPPAVNQLSRHEEPVEVVLDTSERDGDQRRDGDFVWPSPVEQNYGTQDELHRLNVEGNILGPCPTSANLTSGS